MRGMKKWTLSQTKVWNGWRLGCQWWYLKLWRGLTICVRGWLIRWSLLGMLRRRRRGRIWQVRIWIVFRWKSLLTASTMCDKFSFLWVPPFHASILKPNLNLIRKFGLVCLICKLKSILFLVLTWESFSPSWSASFFLSVLQMYSFTWNLLSSPFLWISEKTDRRSNPGIALPSHEMIVF